MENSYSLDTHLHHTSPQSAVQEHYWDLSLRLTEESNVGVIGVEGPSGVDV